MFPPFLFASQGSCKDTSRGLSGHIRGPNLAHTAMVLPTLPDDHRPTNHLSRKRSTHTSRPGDTTPPASQAPPGGLSLIKHSLTREGIGAQAQGLILQAWRHNTTKQYASYLGQWETFCVNEHLATSPPVKLVLDFLTSLVKKGLGHSAVCTARAALSHAVTLQDSHLSVTSHPWVAQLIKGVFHLRPATPRYTQTWDIHTVLQYFRLSAENEYLNLRHLTEKTVMLLTLVTGARGQYIHLIDLRHTSITDGVVTFTIYGPTKCSKPGKPPQQLSVPPFPKDIKVCPVAALREYLCRTRGLRSPENT